MAFAALLIFDAGQAGAQAPDWQVNPSDFESNMSVVAVLKIDGVESTDSNDIVAAFSGDEVRGVAEPVDSGSGLRFFLTVYSDASGEEITFKVYLAALDRVFDLDEMVTFAANGIVGTVSDPFVLSTSTLGTCSRGRPDWVVNPPDYESNMSVTAQVSFEGAVSSDPGDLLAAFVDTEIRGVASPTAAPSGQAFFLTVYSNSSGEEVSFVSYDAANDLVMPVVESLSFVPNAIYGNPATPYGLTASCESISTALEPPARFTAEAGHVYPNPMRDHAVLEFDLSVGGDMTVELMDLLGRRVWNGPTTRLPAGRNSVPIDVAELASGLYVYRLTQGTDSRYGKLTVTR